MFKPEKRFPKREAVSLKVPEEAKVRQLEIRKKIENYTEKVKEKYIEPLKDIHQLMKELAKEKGEEYAFKRILITTNPETSTFAVSLHFPEDLLVSENCLIHYKELKEILKGKPNLINYLNEGIKQAIIHEREHVLEGPSQRFYQRMKDEIGKLKEKYKETQKRLFSLKEKGVRSEREMKEREELEKELEKINAEIDEKDFLSKKYSDIQTDLQRIIKEPEINKIAADFVIDQMLSGEGIRETFSMMKKISKNFPLLTEKESLFYHKVIRSVYSKFYPFLKPKIIEDLTDASIRIEKEILQQYLEWKKEKCPK